MLLYATLIFLCDYLFLGHFSKINVRAYKIITENTINHIFK